MPEISLSVDVAAPPDRVWAAMVDWERQGEWMLGTTVRGTVNGGHGTGAELEAWTGLGPVGFLDTMVITAWDPPYRCVVRHTGRVVRGAAAFEVEPAGAGSRFVWTEWLELPWGRLGELGFVLVRPLVVAGIRYSLRRFATWAATHPT